VVFSNNLLAGSGGQSTGYKIDQSIRFNKSASALMSRTFGTATDRNVFTYAFWMKACSESNGYTLETNTTGGVTFSGMVFNGGSMQFFDYSSGSANIDVRTAFVNEKKFRDYSAWYHAMFVYNSDEGAASDRLKFFINGKRFPSGDFVGPSGGSPVFPGSGANSYFNSSMVHRISSSVNGLVDGYMADIYFIDGQALDPTSFGEFSSTTGQFLPIEYEGTFGNNGFYIDGRDGSDLGDDESGNGNDFSTSNMGTDDQVTDSPTNNTCILNKLITPATMTLVDGNLALSGYTASSSAYGTFGMSSGKWYWELVAQANAMAGIAATPSGSQYPGQASDSYAFDLTNGTKYNNGSSASFGSSAVSAGDTVGVAFDADNGDLKFYNNSGSLIGTAYSSLTSGPYFPVFRNGNSVNISINFGQQTFSHSIPTSHAALTAPNLPDPTIALSEKYFNTVLYEGNGAGQRVGQFQPLTELYSVPNSIIFNDDDSTYLTRTPSSEGNRRTFTFSTWVKFANLKADNMIFSSWVSSGASAYQILVIDSDFRLRVSDNSTNYLITSQVFKDTSSWYHIVFRADTTNSTAADRYQLYINGVRLTEFDTESQPSQNFQGSINATQPHYLGRNGYNLAMIYSDLYQAETYFIDGTAYNADNFGQIDASTNKWIPKDASGLTFGTNGFYLDMAIAPGTGNGAGNDVSGNNNDFTENNLVAADQVTDSPTKNFAVWDFNDSSLNDNVLSDGNLKITTASPGYTRFQLCTLSVKSGKWEWKWTPTASLSDGGIGIDDGTSMAATGGSNGSFSSQSANGVIYRSNGQKLISGVSTSYGASFSEDDVIRTQLNLDASPPTIEFFKNDSSQGTINITGGVDYFPCQFSADASLVTEVDFGQRSFTPASGFNTINNDNLPLSSGELSGFVWIKNRDTTDNNMLFDAVRGIKKDIHSNSTDQQATNANTLTRFLKNGFEISNDNEVNTSAESYVGWQWLFDSLTTSTNDDGTVDSTIIANTTAGVSIAQWTHTTSSNYTVGHGLGATPKMIWVKTLDQGTNWGVYHPYLTTGNRIILNSTGAQSSGYWGANTWNSTVFSIGSARDSNGSTAIGYVFAEVEGFSSIGHFIGNGSTDGSFVYTGFQPAWVITKNINNSGDAWPIADNARSPFNPANATVFANQTTAETTGYQIDLLSNGFKARTTDHAVNESGAAYIYMAFAEQPFKTANAR